MSEKPTLEWSNGRVRVRLRRPTDGGPPPLPESTESTPIHTPGTHRFGEGNQAWRRREVKRRARGITTLDPARCDSWISPFVREGASHGVELLGRFADPALSRLVGSTADALTVFRALLCLAAQGDTEALKESRAWLREYRSCLSTLSALSAGGHTEDGADDAPWLETEGEVPQ